MKCKWSKIVRIHSIVINIFSDGVINIEAIDIKNDNLIDASQVFGSRSGNSSSLNKKLMDVFLAMSDSDDDDVRTMITKDSNPSSPQRTNNNMRILKQSPSLTKLVKGKHMRQTTIDVKNIVPVRKKEKLHNLEGYRGGVLSSSGNKRWVRKR